MWEHSRSRWLAAPTTVLALGLMCVLAFTWGSLQSVELLADAEVRYEPRTSEAGESTVAHHCASTTPGRNYIADNRGHVCHWKDTQNGCCTGVREEERYSCGFCNSTAQCCLVYEYCVSCCLAPANNNLVISMMLSTADPILQSVNTQFEFCQAKCRTSSQSVVDHKEYKSEHKFCYGAHQPSADADEGDYEAVPSLLPPTAEAVAIRGQQPVLVTQAFTTDMASAADVAYEQMLPRSAAEHLAADTGRMDGQGGMEAAPGVDGRPEKGVSVLLAEQRRRDEIYSLPALPGSALAQATEGVALRVPVAGSEGKLDAAAGLLVQNGREQLKPVVQSDYETLTFVDGVADAPSHLNFGHVAWDIDSMFESAASRPRSSGLGRATLSFALCVVLYAFGIALLWR